MVWVLEQNKKYIAQIDEFSYRETAHKIVDPWEGNKKAKRKGKNGDVGEMLEKRIEDIERFKIEKVFRIYGYNKEEDELYELGEYETEEAVKEAMCKICEMLNEDKKCIQMP